MIRSRLGRAAPIKTSRVITRRDRRSSNDGLIVKASGQGSRHSRTHTRKHGRTPKLRHRSLRRKVVTAMSWLIAIAAMLAVLIPLVVVRLQCANRKLNAILTEHHERMDRLPRQAIQDDDEISHRAARAQ